jgi:putative aldouronate transport system permease protein
MPVVINKSVGEHIFDFVNVLLLTILSFVFVYPLWYCLVASISDASQIAAHTGPLLLPLGFSTAAYELIFHSSSILRGLFNSVFYVVVGTFISIVMTSIAAYALSRKGYYWKRTITLMMIFTMYFSGGLIPFYLLVKNVLHLADTPWAIIIPNAVNTFYVIIMRTYFAGIPDSMEESAVMDGANDFRILFSIYLPLAMPVVAVLVVYYGVGLWNSWFSAMIFLIKNRDWQPLQLILREILLQSSAERYTRSAMNKVDQEQVGRLIKYALIILSVSPIVTIYPFMQKYFIKGIMIGSLKE